MTSRIMKCAWTYGCGWHHCGIIFGFVLCFGLCVILVPRCKLDHAICKFLCHCVIYANIMLYWIIWMYIYYCAIWNISRKYIYFLLPRCMLVTGKIIDLSLESCTMLGLWSKSLTCTLFCMSLINKKGLSLVRVFAVVFFPFTKESHMITSIHQDHIDTTLTQYHAYLKSCLSSSHIFKLQLSYLSKMCCISIIGFVLAIVVLI
jgi:hypothetical protein